LIAEFGLRIWNKEMVRIDALPEIPPGKAPKVSGRFQSAIRIPQFQSGVMPPHSKDGEPQ
jgi:hypothetical protein